MVVKSNGALRAALACASIVLVLAGCAEEENPPASGGSGGMGGAGGAAGMMTGGMGGTGGGGTGGMAGGGAGGTGGMAGGGSGGMGGMGGTGGMMAGPPPGCDAADTSGTPAALHAAAAEVLTTQGKCAFTGTCHDGPNRTAGLDLFEATDLNALLVDQPACLTSVVPLVASGGGETALQNSWLWLKLVAPADSSGILIENAAWGTPGASCNQMGGQPYGVRMPYGTTTTYTSDMRLAAIRNWICAGAPGPM